VFDSECLTTKTRRLIDEMGCHSSVDFAKTISYSLTAAAVSIIKATFGAIESCYISVNE
jgi:hypothetical protein